MISKNIDTIDDKGRFVAIELGLIQEGEMCRTWTRYKSQRHESESLLCCEHGLTELIPHLEPPPDFLSPAGADLLLRTLHRRHIDIEIHHEWLTLYGVREVPVHFNGDDYKPALLDAAYNLLALEEK